MVLGENPGCIWDTLALRSNVVSDRSGKPLPYFSPWPSPECVGVNLFAQFSGHHLPDLFRNPYVFPPICLIPDVLRLLCSARLTFTLVVPYVQPRRFWWPLLPHKSSSSLRLGLKGENRIIQFPSKNGYVESSPVGSVGVSCGICAILISISVTKNYGVTCVTV